MCDLPNPRADFLPGGVNTSAPPIKIVSRGQKYEPPGGSLLTHT